VVRVRRTEIEHVGRSQALPALTLRWYRIIDLWSADADVERREVGTRSLRFDYRPGKRLMKCLAAERKGCCSDACEDSPSKHSRHPTDRCSRPASSADRSRSSNTVCRQRETNVNSNDLQLGSPTSAARSRPHLESTQPEHFRCNGLSGCACPGGNPRCTQRSIVCTH